ncbi:hypothetical protein [Dactylosporangium matsuzakiense]|uniref:Uncharacterized protein n=1 Tax=Dactylosporangium matsuzakiense TaxID=53360 RepID=A0A9W6KL61_9ACTN|nr:hypothetical protein [Dactylosporangium matsuzakiense]UWZ45948.1 hypothetical protein Dmats_05640 [Dactylosporangium matsuzakiense]GLL02880.1 hypothetical protein GCM10017581_046220 [Dactylosporangium matsuzakiense]
MDDLELVAAQLRRCADDLSLYGGMLLATLAEALPAHLVAVRREGRLRARLGGRESALLGLTVSLGGRRFELDRDAVGGRPVTVIRHESRGVVLSSETVSADEWCRALTAELVAAAGADSAAARALQRFTSTA